MKQLQGSISLTRIGQEVFHTKYISNFLPLSNTQMSFDWSQYLNLAKELTDQPTTPANQEAKLRDAISRAYYAAFILA